MNHPWTPERERKLTQLWLSGHTRAEVARALGPPITESAVKGKVRRMRLRRDPAAGGGRGAAAGASASGAPPARTAAGPAGTVRPAARADDRPPPGGRAPGSGGTTGPAAGAPAKSTGPAAGPLPDPAVLRETARRVTMAGRRSTDVRESTFRFPGYNECHWPHGEPDHPDFDFCLEPVAPGRSYCEKHAEQAYRKKGS